MGGKLSLYNLGDLGVHLVESPVHSPDGSYRSAQNAAVSQNQGEHGLQKRRGMTKLNAEALAGAVLAITNIPFPDPVETLDITGVALYYNTITDGSNFNGRTLDGLTWGVVSTNPGRWIGNKGVRGGAISTTELLTYVASADSPAVFRDLVTWDGTTQTTILNLSTFTLDTFVSLCESQGVVYLLVTDEVANTSQLYRVDGTTLSSLSATIAHQATVLTPFLGKLWVGTDNNRIYSHNEIAGASIVEHTIVPNVGATIEVTDIEQYNGLLYAAGRTPIGGTDATEDKVLQRAAAGTWSDITPVGAGNGFYGKLCVFNGLLFVARQTDDSFVGCEIYRYDGATWTLDVDVATVHSGADSVLSTITWNGALYASVSGGGHSGIVRRTTAGVWTAVVDESAGSQEGVSAGLGFY